MRTVVTLTTVFLVGGCATGTKTTPAQSATPPSHLYARPLDEVLEQTKQLLLEKGWHVQRSGNTLLTDWVAVEVPAPRSDSQPIAPVATAAAKAPDAIAYRVYGERVDAEYCSIRIVRLVATGSDLYFGEKLGGHQVANGSGFNATPVHHGSSYAFENSDVFQIEEFQAEAPSESAIRVDAPKRTVISQFERDEALEWALQQRLAPPVPAPSAAGEVLPVGGAAAQANAGGAVAAQPARPLLSEVSTSASEGAALAMAERLPSSLAGIWDGSFTFRGNVTGSFKGEVTVAVDGDSAQIDDVCPEGEGTFAAAVSGNYAAWQGTLACRPMFIKGCASVVLTFTWVTVTLKQGTLTLAATGTADTPAGCGFNGGDLSVTFIARRADYVHLSVSRTPQPTACVWPSDWEDLASTGSMAMPEPPPDPKAFLGVIRAKGDRRSEIQALLRHCRHVLLLHGQPVLMRVAGSAHLAK